jgi:phosphate transport system substrate-binding protein
MPFAVPEPAPQRRTLRGLAFLALTGAVLACGSPGSASRDGSNDSTAAFGPTQGSVMTSATVDLTGAGATFPYPLYARWFNAYAPVANVRINYQAVGSGAGIRAMLEQRTDFGATDMLLTASERQAAAGRVIHVPMAIGAVAFTYHLPELTRPLRLSGDVIADLFMGRITRWNDPRLVALNDRVALPDLPVKIVHRADGSGTSYIVTDYLADVSPEWATRHGRGRDVHFPVGDSGEGNEGVAAQVKATKGAIGLR